MYDYFYIKWLEFEKDYFPFVITLQSVSNICAESVCFTNLVKTAAQISQANRP